MVEKNLLILLQAGNEDNGRQATLAAAIGASASLTGAKTVLFLVGRGVFWAYKHHVGDIRIRGYDSITKYFDTILAHKGQILASIPCMQFDASVENILSRDHLWSSIEAAGLDTLVHLTLRSTTLTF